MGLSTADFKQVLGHMILFKVLSLGLQRSLWFVPTVDFHPSLIFEYMAPLQREVLTIKIMIGAHLLLKIVCEFSGELNVQSLRQICCKISQIFFCQSG